MKALRIECNVIETILKESNFHSLLFYDLWFLNDVIFLLFIYDCLSSQGIN